MIDRWSWRDKEGVVAAPITTTELGVLITSGKVSKAFFISKNGGNFVPGHQHAELREFKEPERRDWKALLPLAAGIVIVLALFFGYRWFTRAPGGAVVVEQDDALNLLLVKWPDAAANGSTAAAEAARVRDDFVTCEQQAVKPAATDPQALRLLALCSAIANRYGGQKHREGLAHYLKTKDLPFERAALLSTLAAGEAVAEAQALLRPAVAKNTQYASLLLARLLVRHLPERKLAGTQGERFDDAWTVLSVIATSEPALVLDFAVKSGRLHVFETTLSAPQAKDAPLVIRYVRATGACEWGTKALVAIVRAGSPPPEALTELGLTTAACKAEDTALAAFENDADPARKRAARQGLAAVRIQHGDLEGAKALLYAMDVQDDGAGAGRYVRAVLALQSGDHVRALELFRSSGLSGAAVGAFVAEKLQGTKEPAPLSMIFGPAQPFVSAVLSDRVDDVRLDALFDAPDVLHELNPGRVPLLEAIVAVPVETLRKKPKPSEGDRALIGLYDAWMDKTPKMRAAGDGGSLVAAVLQHRKGQHADAVRAIDRLLKAETDAPPLGLAALRARSLERSAKETADETWAQLAEHNDELEPAAELATARTALANGDTKAAADQLRALYFAGEASLEAMRLLSFIEEKP